MLASASFGSSRHKRLLCRGASVNDLVSRKLRDNQLRGSHDGKPSCPKKGMNRSDNSGETCRKKYKPTRTGKVTGSN